MSIWDDIGAQAGIDIYAGLSPEQALQKWYGIQQQMREQGYQPGQQGPGGEILGSMENLARQNPDAFRLRAQGTAPTKNEAGKNVRQVFNPNTGQFDTQETHGWFSHPESWAQLALGGAFGAAAPAALASGAPAVAAPGGVLPSTAVGTGMVGPIAGGTGLTAAETGGAASTLGAVAGPTAAGGTMGTLGRLAPYLIAGGTDLAGGLIGSKASKDAAKQQMAYGQQAMDAMRNAYGQELGFYGQQRDVYAPYNQIGQSALSNLARLTGSPVPQAAPSNPTMIRLQAPDGSIQAVPESDVQHYIQRGARIA